MIEKVRLKFFKKFKDQSFDLTSPTVLAGPNNSGKTTLLQAIATWDFAFRAWNKRNSEKSKASNRRISLTRQEFLTMPLPRLNLLWTDSSTALGRSEGGGRGAATPRILEITLAGKNSDGKPWSHTMEFLYANSEMLYVKPTDGSSLPKEGISIVYVPPLSGIETEEKIHAPEYQKWLIGQGKPGDITRNLMAEVSKKETDWENLTRDIKEIFGHQLLKPKYEGRPHILCEYRPEMLSKKGPGGRHPKFDIASAGSGFLQALLLLSFVYARPSTILLIDELDAHLHVSLQRQIYTHLQKIASKRKCQLIVATHSGVIIDDTPGNKIISFYGKAPHLLLGKAQKEEVREALKMLTSTDLLQSQCKKIIYVEGVSDFHLLRTFTERLDHKFKEWVKSPYYWKMDGGKLTEAKHHFFALKAIHPDIRGALILDSDGKKLTNHEVGADDLKVLRWERYEIENYLIHPDLIRRFCTNYFGPLFAHTAVEEVEKEMKKLLPSDVMGNPLNNHDYLNTTSASKEILPTILDAAGINIGKQEYYKIAEEMRPEEIHPEIIEKLDAITSHLEI